MKHALRICLFWLAGAASALAQGNPVYQGGTVTPNQVPYWVSDGVLGGGVTANDSPINTFGITANSNAGFCVSSQRATAAGRQQMCFGTTDTGGGIISVQNYGTDNPETFTLTINGAPYSFGQPLLGPGQIAANYSTVTSTNPAANNWMASGTGCSTTFTWLSFGQQCLNTTGGVTDFTLGINLSQTAGTPNVVPFMTANQTASSVAFIGTAFNANAFAAAANFNGTRWDGTVATPTALQNGDNIASFDALGYNGTGVVGPQAALRTFANQNWSVGANGTYLDIAITPNGSATLTPWLNVNGSGVAIGSGVTSASSVNGAVLDIYGPEFIYSNFSGTFPAISFSSGGIMLGWNGSPTTQGEVDFINIFRNSGNTLNGGFGWWNMASRTAVSTAPLMFLGADGGLYIGAPSGLDKGAGTFNLASNLYLNGALATTTISSVPCVLGNSCALNTLVSGISAPSSLLFGQLFLNTTGGVTDLTLGINLSQTAGTPNVVNWLIGNNSASTVQLEPNSYVVNGSGVAASLIAGPTSPTPGTTAAVNWLYGTSAAQSLFEALAVNFPSPQDVRFGFGVAAQCNNSGDASNSSCFAFADYVQSTNLVQNTIAGADFCVGAATGAYCEGRNIVIYDDGVHALAHAYGLEVDLATSQAPTTFAAAFYAQAFNVNYPGPAYAISGASSGTFANGFYAISGIKSTGTVLGAASTVSVNSLWDCSTATFAVCGRVPNNLAISYTSASGNPAQIYNDTNSSLHIVAGSGNFIALQTNALDALANFQPTIVEFYEPLELGLIGSSVGELEFANATSGLVSITPPIGALGSSANTLQAVTDTFVYRATTDTLTNKTITFASNTLTGVAPLASPTFTGTVTSTGHILASNGTAPAVSACGTSPSMVGSDVAGKITAGSGVLTSCTLTFGTAFGVAPACNVSSGTAIASMTVTTTTTTLVIGGTSLTSDVIAYNCFSTAMRSVPANDNYKFASNDMWGLRNEKAA